MKTSIAAAAAAVLLAPQVQAEVYPYAGPEKLELAEGWTLKPRGRLQYDLGWIEEPDGVERDGLGWESEFRRVRIGFQLDSPYGVGAKFEVDFAGTLQDSDSATIADMILTYEASEALELTFGQHNNYQSLEELSSSNYISFVERAAFTDAFGFERRVGLSAEYSAGGLIAQAGVFTDNIAEFDDDPGTPLGVDARVVYAPEWGGAQAHFGASLHYSDRDVPGGDLLRYRQRPQTHPTDVRFVNTGRFPVSEETNYGVEAAWIDGPLHFAAEAHWLTASAVDAADPTFFGAYAEAGYFLTGETRGYKGGKFDRTAPLRPVGKGGIGAVELNLRYDRLDLTDAGIVGGTQDGYLAGLLWIPAKHVRFLADYGVLDFKDAAIVAANGDTDYAVDRAAIRFQLDF